jgi:hypothetical protein
LGLFFGLGYNCHARDFDDLRESVPLVEDTLEKHVLGRRVLLVLVSFCALPVKPFCRKTTKRPRKRVSMPALVFSLCFWCGWGFGSDGNSSALLAPGKRSCIHGNASERAAAVQEEAPARAAAFAGTLFPAGFIEENFTIWRGSARRRAQTAVSGLWPILPLLSVWRCGWNPPATAALRSELGI